MAHGAFSLSSRLQSVPFLSFSLLFLLLLSPCFSLRFSSPSPCSWLWVPSHAQRLNLHALPLLPVVSANALRDDCGAWNVRSWVMCLCFIWPSEAGFTAAETWESPCLRILMKCSKTGANPPLSRWSCFPMHRSWLSQRLIQEWYQIVLCF